MYKKLSQLFFVWTGAAITLWRQDMIAWYIFILLFLVAILMDGLADRCRDRS